MFLDLGMEEIDVMGLLKVILGLDVDEDVKKVVKWLGYYLFFLVCVVVYVK